VPCPPPDGKPAERGELNFLHLSLFKVVCLNRRQVGVSGDVDIAGVKPTIVCGGIVKFQRWTVGKLGQVHELASASPALVRLSNLNFMQWTIENVGNIKINIYDVSKGIKEKYSYKLG
jgi:hypothetical protein